jgi:hypothetical protein
MLELELENDLKKDAVGSPKNLSGANTPRMCISMYRYMCMHILYVARSISL